MPKNSAIDRQLQFGYGITVQYFDAACCATRKGSDLKQICHNALGVCYYTKKNIRLATSMSTIKVDILDCENDAPTCQYHQQKYHQNTASHSLLLML